MLKSPEVSKLMRDMCAVFLGLESRGVLLTADEIDFWERLTLGFL